MNRDKLKSFLKSFIELSWVSILLLIVMFIAYIIKFFYGMNYLIALLIVVLILRYIYYFYKQESLKVILIGDLKSLIHLFIISLIVIHFKNPDFFQNQIKYSMAIKIISERSGKNNPEIAIKLKNASIEEKIYIY